MESWVTGSDSAPSLGGVVGDGGSFSGWLDFGASISVVPSQKLDNRDRRMPPGVGSPSEVNISSCECDPGTEAVCPRIGSVNSCSGEGSASGDMSTLDAAHRIAATVVCTSEPDDDPELVATMEAVDVEEEKELRVRCPGRESWKGRSSDFCTLEIDALSAIAE